MVEGPSFALLDRDDAERERYAHAAARGDADIAWSSQGRGLISFAPSSPLPPSLPA